MFGFLDAFKKSLDNVKNKIEYEKLQIERNKYYDLSDKVKLIIKDLKSSLENLNSVSNKVINGYSVDNISGDDNYLDNKREDIQSTYNYLVNTILPEIEKKITELSNNMEKIDLD